MAALPTSRADSSGSCTRSAISSADARWAPATSATNATAFSYRPSSSSPRSVCSWLACSWSCARSASNRPWVLSSSRPSSSSSVRSRRVTTAPSSRVGTRLATSTRPPLTASRSAPDTRPDSTSAVRPGASTSSGVRPAAVAASRPSSRAASSLTSRILPYRSQATTPSRMPCSIASRSSSSAEISANATPCVRRRRVRETASVARTPTASAAPVYRSSPGMLPSSRPRTLSYAIPTDTAPTIRPRPSRSGTLARADRPSVPVSICRTSRPASGRLGSVETCRPISAGFGCDQRTPRVSITTMYSALVAVRIRSASACTGPRGSGPVATSSRARSGSAAVVWAIDSARRIAWSSSSAPSGARNRPVARTITPVVMTTCAVRTCAKIRRGRRIRIPASLVSRYHRTAPRRPGPPRPRGSESSACRRDDRTVSRR